VSDAGGRIGPGEGFPGVDGAAESTGDEPLNRVAAAMRRISAVVTGSSTVRAGRPMNPLNPPVTPEARVKIGRAGSGKPESIL